MTYAVRQPDGQGIAEITYSGAITAADLRASTSECIALQKKTGTMKFLLNADGWELVASTIDVYDLPEKVYGQQDLDRRTRIAIVLPHAATARQGALFFEDACRNRGWNARVVGDHAAAVAWLSKP